MITLSYDSSTLLHKEKYKYARTLASGASTFQRMKETKMKLLVLLVLFGLSAAQHDPHYKHGHSSIVHLFEWRWADIAEECERYLAPNGFGGVQVITPT